MNEWLFGQVNGFAQGTPWLHPLVTAYAGYGVVVFAGLLVVGWWSARRAGSARRIAAVLCASVATLVAVAANQPIVSAVREARPYTTHPQVLVLVHRSTDFSFPSDHAVMAGAVAAGLWFGSRSLAAAAAAAALLMAFSRVYVGVHYPGDVAAGLVLGAVVAVACYTLGGRLLARAVQAVAGTRLRMLLVSPSSASAVSATRSDQRRGG